MLQPWDADTRPQPTYSGLRRSRGYTPGNKVRLILTNGA